MHIARGHSIVPFDPEIERTITRLRVARQSLSSSISSEEEPQQEEQARMGENQRVALKELGIPGAYRFESGIAPPTTPANDFEIRSAMITLIERRQFSGAKHESPLNHLKEFEKYCNTIKVNGVSQEFIRLKLFPFSLIGRALEWLDKEVKPNSLTTWDEVTKEFLTRFYP